MTKYPNASSMPAGNLYVEDQADGKVFGPLNQAQAEYVLGYLKLNGSSGRVVNKAAIEQGMLASADQFWDERNEVFSDDAYPWSPWN